MSSGFLERDGGGASPPGSGAAPSLRWPTLFGGLGGRGAAQNAPPRPHAPEGAAEKRLAYLFEDEYVPNGPSWGARICYGAGATYISGLAAGGAWGLVDGLRNEAGARSARLRLNCIVNSCTARGPFAANNVAILALLYNLIHGGAIRARGGKYDWASATASAGLAGAIYKSTSGSIRTIAKSSLAAAAAMAAFQGVRENRHLFAA